MDLCMFVGSRPETVFSNKRHFELQQVFPFLLRAALCLEYSVGLEPENRGRLTQTGPYLCTFLQFEMD